MVCKKLVGAVIALESHWSILFSVFEAGRSEDGCRIGDSKQLWGGGVLSHIKEIQVQSAGA